MSYENLEAPKHELRTTGVSVLDISMESQHVEQQSLYFWL